MSEKEYKELKKGDLVIIRYGGKSGISRPRKLQGKSSNGSIIWFYKIRESWTKSRFAYYSKWNALAWMSVA